MLCLCTFSIVPNASLQVKDVLFEPVRKTQDAMFFYKTKDDVWVPCGPRQPGAVQTTMQDLAAKGLAAKVCAEFKHLKCCLLHQYIRILAFAYSLLVL